MLVKGVLLFIAFGMLSFFLFVGVEFFLWLNSTGRLVLLICLLFVEVFLLYRYILVPMLYLTRLKAGISNKEASRIIGKHFPSVNDKLVNLLDLAKDNASSELLLASIEQRSNKLDNVPFTKAVNFKDNVKYIPYLGIPLIVLLLLGVSGGIQSFFSSYNRVVNYNLAYEPPAPFYFEVLNDSLSVYDNGLFELEISTVGEVKPQDVYIVIDGEKIVMSESQGIYKYTFNKPLSDARFYLEGNNVVSRDYNLIVIKTPLIQEFEMLLDFPSYLGMFKKVIKGTGNATFPEGTKISWSVVGKNTQKVNLKVKDTVLSFVKNADNFNYVRRFYSDLEYQILTSNDDVRNFDKLNYNFKVVKDAYPSIKVKEINNDSISLNAVNFTGEISDDYGLTKLKLVYYNESDREDIKEIVLANPESNFDTFYYTFPSGLDLEEGKQYNYYFEVFDNDAIRNFKSVKSEVFRLFLYSDKELKNKELDSNKNAIDDFKNTLKESKEQQKNLEEITKGQREKKALSFNDKNNIKDFIQRQQHQEQLAEKFSKQLHKSIRDKEKGDLNDLLKERLERQELEAKRNKRLLEELNEVADKINKEQLAKKLEQLAKNQKSNMRNLEQLLELTKRYYVSEKVSKVARDLKELAKEQKEASELLDKQKSLQTQKELNKQFDALKKELSELKKDNDKLEKPLPIKNSEEKQNSISGDQKEAVDKLNSYDSKGASKKQKSASDKMNEMSDSLSQSSAGGGEDSIAEDAEMLRQVLDNLVIFSFKQEKLYEAIDVDSNDGAFAERIKEQKGLRNLFEHVDDSLFALSLRRAELSEFVNEQINEVYYNVDKALDNMAENRSMQTASYQKYVLNASNSLADFLAKLLDNMEQSMKSGSGSGAGKGFQLPDIIKGQQSLGEKMNGAKPGSKGNSGKGNGSEGKSGENGDEGGKKSGNGDGNEEGKGKGKSGKNGDQGRSGNGAGLGGRGSGEGSSETPESNMKEIYEIYKQQQQIRAELEKQLEDMINDSDKSLTKKILQQMRDFESDLIESGITRRTQSKVNIIQYELMKIKGAALKQGKKNEREANQAKKQFNNSLITRPSVLDNNTNEVEILKRQSLPLRPNYKTKVKSYFKSDD